MARHPQLGDPGTLSHQAGIQRQKSGGASNAFGDRVNRLVNCVLINYNVSKIMGSLGSATRCDR